MNDATRPKHAPGDLSEGLSSLLSSLGVSSTSERDDVCRVVAHHLATRGVCARVASLRHGVLTLEAAPSHAALLRYDLPGLLDTLAAEVPGTVAEARVRTTRER